MIKVVAFDLFGTVFDLSAVPKDEVREYIRQVRRPEWAPLTLPDSWKYIPAFKDSYEGLKKIREYGYITTTCSNAPHDLQKWMIANAGLEFVIDYILPFDSFNIKAYKPNPKTYGLIPASFGLDPSQCLMVTGNEGSPDIDGARVIGMKAAGIRNAGPIKDIVELAEKLKGGEVC